MTFLDDSFLTTLKEKRAQLNRQLAKYPKFKKLANELLAIEIKIMQLEDAQKNDRLRLVRMYNLSNLPKDLAEIYDESLNAVIWELHRQDKNATEISREIGTYPSFVRHRILQINPLTGKVSTFKKIVTPLLNGHMTKRQCPSRRTYVYFPTFHFTKHVLKIFKKFF